MSHLGVQCGCGSPYRQPVFGDSELFWRQFSQFLENDVDLLRNGRDWSGPTSEKVSSLVIEEEREGVQSEKGWLDTIKSYVWSSSNQPEAAKEKREVTVYDYCTPRLSLKAGEIKAEIYEQRDVDGRTKDRMTFDQTSNLKKVINIFRGNIFDSLSRERLRASVTERQSDPYTSFNELGDKFICCRNEIWELVKGKFFNFLDTHGIQNKKNGERRDLAWRPEWNQGALPNYPLPDVPAVSEFKELGRAMYEFAKEGIDTDVTIEAGTDTRRLFAHKLILSRCPALRRMLNSGMAEGRNRIIHFKKHNFAVVAAFIKYLYLEEDPFEEMNTVVFEPPNKEGDSPILESGAVIVPKKLLSLAHSYGIGGLVNYCCKYIALNNAENAWELLEQYGIYQQRDLLATYGAYCIRHGKSLTMEMVGIFQKLDLPLPTPSREVSVNCDVGFGNTLGIRFEPEFNESVPFEWSQEVKGWVGRVPVGKKFKFVKIHENSSFAWEEKKGNRTAIMGDGRIAIHDVYFK